MLKRILVYNLIAFYFSHILTIGLMYHNGQGCAVDYPKALKYFQLAADKGVASSQNYIGFNISNIRFLFLFSLHIHYRNHVLLWERM